MYMVLSCFCVQFSYCTPSPDRNAFRITPSTYCANSPSTRHKGAGPKCYHDTSLVPSASGMRELEEKQGLKGLEPEARMCNNVNNFTY